jgi:predicted short-subunit dehydrogenase-like oxidoreductase (DUF2520 family)
MNSILLIGTGRMAYHLGHALVKSGQPLIGVTGRDHQKLADLSRFLDRPAWRWEQGLPAVDLIIIATSDDSLAEVAGRLKPGPGVVAHTAGAVGLDVLEPHTHRAVLWPIQTLSHGAPIDLGDVPLVVEGSTKEARSAVLRVASGISSSVLELTHPQRELIHLTAVLASNLTVFLVGEAQRLLKAGKLPPSLLTPLWRTTANKVSTIGPEQSLTGPARRGDISSVKRHIELLKDEPDLRRAYALLSAMVLRAHGHSTDGIADL